MVGLRSLRDLVPPYYLIPDIICEMHHFEAPKPHPTLRELKQVQEAEQAFRFGLQCAVEPDVKTSILFELALLLDDASAERTQLLEEAQGVEQ